ncbi:ABC transporter permease [Pelagibius sp.]|uniref:ABC transporter permease n=1 Tax=Pelagibius sp. TaxID=1931238 RepID=UPI003B5112C4
MTRRDLLAYLPGATLLLFLTPVAAGLIGTWLPAFGYFPTLGGEGFTLDPWVMLFDHPGLRESLRLTLVSGLLATVISFSLTVFFLAACHGCRITLAIRGLMAPLLAVPHAAMALGLAFLIAPSGWLVRLVSPWATGWDLPPDVATVQDPNALALTLGLVMKELPFLLLMTLAALEHSRAEERLAIARSLGYGPVMAWLKTVLPAIYRQIRLPVYAVLAYSLSVVDMALILAPLSPPPLAVQVFRWFNDPDLTMRFVAAAGAVLQLLVVVGAIALWRLAEVLVARLGRLWIAGGRRGGKGRVLRAATSSLVQLLVAMAAAGLLAMALWSVTRRWRYPDALPTALSTDIWARQGHDLLWTTGTTLISGLAAAFIAVALVLGCLENEQRRGLTISTRALWLLYVPLLVPQVAFLFGSQVLSIQIGIDGTWIALVWSHLLFVLPYVFLSLADHYRALDERYSRTALCLGASPNRVFWRVKLPMLLRPVLFAAAVGFAVSVTQYLPTLFAGAGRFVTLTTEAVSLSAGGDRRVMGVFAFLQAALPLIAFAAALALPRRLARSRILREQRA